MKLNALPAGDRRRFKRFELCLKAYFVWTSADGENKIGVGTTRDVSTQGAFVIGNSCPEEGSVAKLEFALPSVGVSRRMKLRGRIVRTEVAVAEHTYGFGFHADRPASVVDVNEARHPQRQSHTRSLRRALRLLERT